MNPMFAERVLTLPVSSWVVLRDIMLRGTTRVISRTPLSSHRALGRNIIPLLEDINRKLADKKPSDIVPITFAEVEVAFLEAVLEVEETWVVSEKVVLEEFKKVVDGARRAISRPPTPNLAKKQTIRISLPPPRHPLARP